jgi:hypothetical protein
MSLDPKYWPKYQHDCDVCEFIETDSLGDWYICIVNSTSPEQIGILGSIICRYSDEGSRYWSSPIGMVDFNRYPTLKNSPYGTKAYSILATRNFG